MSCFYFLPSLVSNKVHRKGSDTWCSFEAAGKDVEEEEEEEEEEGGERKVNSLQRIPVELRQSL